MDLNGLVAFERVVREGSFSRAAWALGVSQPTISARIQALEVAVGGALFRRGRQVTLTERGVRFLPHTRRLLAALNDGLEAARSDSGQGRLAIGALRSLTGGLLGPALVRFRERHGDVECYAREGDHWQLLEYLADGAIELGIVCWPVQDPLLADLRPVLTLRETMVLAVRPHHPLAGLEEASEADVVRLADPFMLLRWWQTTPLEIASLAARARASMDLPIGTGLHLARHGDGAGFFPRMLVASDLERGTLAEVRLRHWPPVYRDTALVHLARRSRLSGPARAAVEVIAEVARTLPLEALAATGNPDSEG